MVLQFIFVMNLCHNNGKQKKKSYYLCYRQARFLAQFVSAL